MKVASPSSLLHRLRIFLVVLLCGSGLLFSCEVKAPTATIIAREYVFSPLQVVLPARQSVHIILHNQGRERHVFHAPILNNPSVHLSWLTKTVELQSNGVILLPPGRTVAFSLVLPPGIYPFRCFIRGHTGMEGSLIVKDRPLELRMNS